jgi:hypothetical protein
MADSTDTPNRYRSIRAAVRTAACVGVLLVAAVWQSGPAWADGDPASDVLVSQSLFLPEDAGLPVSQQSELLSLLATAQRRGYPIRVAVVASPADLGSVGALWRRPASYAQFLGQELALVYRGRVLVVMPDGLGLFPANGTGARERSALASLVTPQRAMGVATIDAVRALAAAAGHPLPLPSAPAISGSGSGDAVGWVVFAVGCVLIVAAWTASLRVRPLRPRP